jgi:plastocyanin
MRYMASAVCLIALAGLVIGCGGRPNAGTPSPNRAQRESAARSVTVDIASFKYKPAVITVKKGARVTWTNSDSVVHTATADDRSFDTQSIARGQPRTVTFTSPGTIPYHCDYHPFMDAIVVVK